MKTFVTYVPVVHQGYMRVIEAVKPDEIVLINKDEYLEVFPELRKDIRALSVDQVIRILQSLFPAIKISELKTPLVQLQGKNIVGSNDQLTRHVLNALSKSFSIEYHSAFLRWDKENIWQPQQVTHVQSDSPVALTVTETLAELKDFSGDWWRQVAAAIVKDGQLLLADYNHHVPSEHEPYYQGDPRGLFHKKEAIELSTAQHAEASLIAKAARQGLALAGTTMYVTTFPCPPCAKLLAYSGITQLFFLEGYSMVDGFSVLENQGVQVTQLTT